MEKCILQTLHPKQVNQIQKLSEELKVLRKDVNLALHSKDKTVLKVGYVYATKSIVWYLIYDLVHPDKPPDILLGDCSQPELTDKFYDFLDLPYIKAHLKSWQDWKLNNENALLELVQDLQEAYKDFLMGRINSSEVVNELKALADTSTEIALSDRLVIATVNLGQAVSLPAPDLQFHMLIEDAEVENVFWSLSKPAEELLRKPLPRFSPADSIGSTLQSAKEYISDRYLQLGLSLKLRREFIATALALAGPNLIEFDTDRFESIALQPSPGWIASFQLESNFPATPPKIRLSSPHSLKNSLKPDISAGYSSEWSARKIFKACLQAVKDEVQKSTPQDEDESAAGEDADEDDYRIDDSH